MPACHRPVLNVPSIFRVIGTLAAALGFCHLCSGVIDTIWNPPDEYVTIQQPPSLALAGHGFRHDLDAQFMSVYSGI
jgi:hypothetical protein